MRASLLIVLSLILNWTATAAEKKASSPAATAPPAWWTKATPNIWYDLGKLVGYNTDITPPTSGITAYSGAVVNTVGVHLGKTWTPGTFLVLFGGGHGDSNINSVYAFGPLGSEKPTLHQLSQMVSMDNVAQSNGYPASRHTYGTIAYDAAKNWMICAGSPAVYSAAGSFNDSFVFDFAVADPMINNPWVRCVDVIGNTTEVCGAVRDPATGRYYFTRFGGSGVLELLYATPGATAAQTAFGRTGLSEHLSAYSSACDGDGVHSLMVIAPSGTNPFIGVGQYPVAINLTTGVVTKLHPAGTGPEATLSSTNNSAGGIAWVKSRGAFAVMLKVMNGVAPVPEREIYWLKPGPDPFKDAGWTWQKEITADGEFPTRDYSDTNGIYGKFRYVENPSMLIYVPCTNLSGSKIFVRKIAQK